MDLNLIKARDLVKGGSLQDAMLLMLEITGDRGHRFHKEVILHSASLQQARKDERLGIVSPGYVSREQRRITLALLDLIDELMGEGDRREEQHAPDLEHVSAEAFPVDPREEIHGGVEPLRVFICYSSDDRAAVRSLYERLKREQGLDPWLDTEELLPGVDWDLEIRSAVRAASVVLVCLSNHSINREGYLQKEIRQALDIADEKPDGTIFLIPVRLEDCEVPLRLQRWQWLDLFEEGSYGRLLNSLRRRATSSLKQKRGRP
jgi:hypothetical protein